VDNRVLVTYEIELTETLMDIPGAKPAVFKTVCGALLRRPGWVRFPSIPATPGGLQPRMTPIAD
jgi:hypothetical protein